jgi:type I restriction enzyme S subunit
MSWQTERLGNLLAPSGNTRAGEQDLPILSITMHEGLVDQSAKFKKRVASRDISSYRVVYANELVVGFPIDEGVLGFQKKYPAAVVSPAYGIWKLRKPAETHIPFVEGYLRSSEARRIYADKMRGGVARRRSITREGFLEIEIPFPPLDDQKRIAAVLDKAKSLRRQRQESIQLTERLVQSVFLDMFGDLSRDGLQDFEFQELAVPGRGMFSNGPFGSDLLTSELQDAGVPVVYIRDIRNGEFAWKSNVFVSPEKAATLPSCEVRPGDLLITKVGDPPGVAALYPADLSPAIVTQDVIRVRLNARIAHPIFVQHYLNSDQGRHLIETITVEGTRSRFSLRDLKTLCPFGRPAHLHSEFPARLIRHRHWHCASHQPAKNR